jgi:hypothetical protein
LIAKIREPVGIRRNADYWIAWSRRVADPFVSNDSSH